VTNGTIICISRRQEVCWSFRFLLRIASRAKSPESHRRTTGVDEKGFYQFVDAPERRYSIAGKKAGYRNHTISAVTLRGGEAVNMPEIKMSPRRRRRAVRQGVLRQYSGHRELIPVRVFIEARYDRRQKVDRQTRS